MPIDVLLLAAPSGRLVIGAVSCRAGSPASATTGTTAAAPTPPGVPFAPAEENAMTTLLLLAAIPLAVYLLVALARA